MKFLDSERWRRLEPDASLIRSKLSTEFSTTELQIAHVSELIIDDLHQVDCKENRINELFRGRTEEYKHAKTKLEALKKNKEVESKKSEELAKTLGRLNKELKLCKQKIDAKGSSITDNAPLIEIRIALQRLRSENKELDVRIGVLVSICSFHLGFLFTRGLTARLANVSGL